MSKRNQFIFIREGKEEREVEVYVECTPKNFAFMLISFLGSEEGEEYRKALMAVLQWKSDNGEVVYN